VKPPVDAPTSRQRKPATDHSKASSARSSFSPPRLTKRVSSWISSRAPSGTLAPAFVAGSPLTDTFPAMMSA
jgi:hypothetical protein